MDEPCTRPPMKHNSDSKSHGLLLSEITDVAWLQRAVEQLWQLLDDIDTAEDMAKGNLEVYERLVHWQQRKRFQVLTSDGYGLFKPTEEPS